MNSNENDNSQNYNELKFDTGIGPLIDKILNTILNKLNTENFKGKLVDKIVDPITGIIIQKIRPYIYAGIILYLILVVLLVFIIYLLLKQKSLK